MKYTPVFLALLFWLALDGQQQPEAQLKERLSEVRGTARVDVLIELSEELRPVNAEEARKYADEGYKLSTDLNYAAGTRNTALFLAIYERSKGRYKRSLALTRDFLSACRTMGDEEGELDGLRLFVTLCDLIDTKKSRKERELAVAQIEILKKQLKLEDKMELKEEELRVRMSELVATLAENEEISTKIERVEEDLAQMTREKLEEQNRRISIALEKANILAEKLTIERDNEALMREKQELTAEKKLKELEISKRERGIVILVVALIGVLLTSFMVVQYYRLKRLREEERQRSQRQLMMQEKMATLGQLATGIAHEIKNPLNFVNNFAEGSAHLVEDLEEAFGDLEQDFSPENKAECQELMSELKANAGDIQRNGDRIDRIVRSMMAHARGGKGQIEPTDINRLVKENLNLAYHGFRGLHNSFNVEIKETYDPELEQVDVIPQDMSRVFLNIFGNAIYALNEKRQQISEDYRPRLWVKTEQADKNVLISISDNGPGIPESIRKDVFTPFFTTKPQSSGNTGLGLSLSYDIVVQGHHGTLDLDSKDGEYTRFTISLPA